MILSASRRCDVPAFYGDWLINRLKMGYVCVRNPYDRRSVTKILLNPQGIDCIVLWTKDAAPFMKCLPKLDELGYRYYFQYTLTPYESWIERSFGDKEKAIKTFCTLSERLGKERVVWRYDPILLTRGIDVNWHIEKFRNLCERLHAYTERVVISFLDVYQMREDVEYRTPKAKEMRQIGSAFAEIAREKGLRIQTCGEEISIEGVEKGACIDKALIERICGYPILVRRDWSNPECLCEESVDIGEYNLCPHCCKYCYANNNAELIEERMKEHNDHSPFIFGNYDLRDKLHTRKVSSLRSLD